MSPGARDTHTAEQSEGKAGGFGHGGIGSELCTQHEGRETVSAHGDGVVDKVVRDRESIALAPHAGTANPLLSRVVPPTTP